MTFADLRPGDHFIWPPSDGTRPDSVNVNIKTAAGEDGGGFAIDLATRQDSVSPSVPPDSEDPPCWIPGNAPVIKLNGTL
jgi:hypothetical protein